MAFYKGSSTDGANLTELVENEYEVLDEYVSHRLWVWGDDAQGQLGDNSIVDKSTPVQTISVGVDWRLIECGNAHTSAIKTDGTLWLWGHNGHAQLGDNSIVNKSTPVQVAGAGTNWKLISCGAYNTAAIKTDGTLWLWGFNDYGGLGDNSITKKSTPVQTVLGGTDWKSVAIGRYHTTAIKTDGTLWTWGYNLYGQLGDNDPDNKSTPVQVAGAGTSWKSVAVGYFHASAIKTDGTLWTWGRSNYGQLGDNSKTDKSTPVQVAGAGTNWKSVSAGQVHTAAIKTDGTLWLWGFNNYGELGDNSVADKSTPVQVEGAGTNWKSISHGVYHTAAIKTDGTLWLWGRNDYGQGQLGDNSIVSKSTPVQTSSAGYNWKSVSCGRLHTAAVTFRD